MTLAWARAKSACLRWSAPIRHLSIRVCARSPLVTRIQDSEGNIVAEFEPRMNEVISEESATKMIYMLKAVVDGGTASRLRYKYGFTGELGGKTGTTNKNSGCMVHGTHSYAWSVDSGWRRRP